MIINRTSKTTTLRDLIKGDIYEFEDDVFMMLDETEVRSVTSGLRLAVALSCATVVSHSVDQKVIPLQAEVNILGEREV